VRLGLVAHHQQHLNLDGIYPQFFAKALDASSFLSPTHANASLAERAISGVHKVCELDVLQTTLTDIQQHKLGLASIAFPKSGWPFKIDVYIILND